MTHPTTRVLAVLELLQTHRRLSGAELASRIEVDRRTIRRYIALLEAIGIPITTGRGPLGGYELVPGYKLPPMMFTNDEALALSLGLAAARGFGLAEGSRAIEGAQAKLERVMPANLKGPMRAIGESVTFAQRQHLSPTDNSNLQIFGSCAHARQGVSLRYQASSGNESEREFDPYGLAYSGGRWYTVGFCRLRKSLRSFRVDRVVSVVPQTREFERPENFDVMRHLVMSIATLPRKFQIEVVLRTNLESARRELFPAFGVLEPLDRAVLLRSQADDLNWFARELARLPWPFEIRKPMGLTDAVVAHAQTLVAARSATPYPPK